MIMKTFIQIISTMLILFLCNLFFKVNIISAFLGVIILYINIYIENYFRNKNINKSLEGNK